MSTGKLLHKNGGTQEKTGFRADTTVAYHPAPSGDESDDSETVPDTAESPLVDTVGTYKSRIKIQSHRSTYNVSTLPSYALLFGLFVFYISGLLVGLYIGWNWGPLVQNKNGHEIDLKTACNCPDPEYRSTLTQSLVTKSSYPATTPRVADDQQGGQSSLDPGKCGFCKRRNPVSNTGDSRKVSLFAPLSMEEMNYVKRIMFTKVYASMKQVIGVNRISHIYLHPAIKSEALDYLDNNGQYPGRYAKVHVVRPNNNPPDVMEYKVGPLDAPYTNVSIERLRENGEIDFNRRPYDPVETSLLNKMANPQIKVVENLIKESFLGSSDSIQGKVFPDISLLPTANKTERLSSAVLMFDRMGQSTLRLLPLSFRIHHPGKDTSAWYTFDWFYLNQGPYSSPEHLQQAYKSGSLRKIVFPSDYLTSCKSEFDLVRNTSLPPRHLSDIPPPRTYETDGPRYTVSNNQVRWMGWQFEFSSDPVRGPSLFDIRFMGTRIAFEISLQDVTLIYSSGTNGQGPPVLSDTFFLIGSYTKPILDVDCPARSHIFNATGFLANEPYEMEAACLFEADGQKPLWKHNSKGLADHYLVVRATINLDNYDYSFEWRFHLDGRLVTVVTASGYLYGAFWDENGHFPVLDETFTPFGYKLGEYLLGPTHDHTFAFKIDLDIFGTKNTFESVTWKANKTANVYETTQKPKYFYFNNTRYIVHDFLEKEDSFILDTQKPMILTVVNENQKNSWNLRKGYRIIPHSNFAEILEDHLLLNSWDQLKYQLAVSKRKDSENYVSNSIYELTHPRDPVSGKMVLNDEMVRNEDLVLWLSEKFYHVPTSEDVPMTLPAEIGFTLKPYNYFDRTPLFDLPAHYNKNPFDFEPCYENKYS